MPWCSTSWAEITSTSGAYSDSLLARLSATSGLLLHHALKCYDNLRTQTPQAPSKPSWTDAAGRADRNVIGRIDPNMRKVRGLLVTHESKVDIWMPYDHFIASLESPA